MWRRRWMARICRSCQRALILRSGLHAGWRPDQKQTEGKVCNEEKRRKATTRGDDSGDIPQLPRCRLLCSKSHIALHWDSVSLIITRCVCLTRLHQSRSPQPTLMSLSEGRQRFTVTQSAREQAICRTCNTRANTHRHTQNNSKLMLLFTHVTGNQLQFLWWPLEATQSSETPINQDVCRAQKIRSAKYVPRNSSREHLAVIFAGTTRVLNF